VIRFGLIGCGRFGRHYLTNLERHSLGRVSLLCTRRPVQEIPAATLLPWTEDFQCVCRSQEVDCVIVATPPGSHYRICREALLAGKHVICEKPFVFEPHQAEELCRLAEERNAILLINYIHLWNARLTEFFQSFDFSGQTQAFLSFQSNSQGPFRSDCPMLWDWYSHDLALLLHHVGGRMKHFRKSLFFNPGPSEAGVLSVEAEFERGRAHSYINTLAAGKRRSISIATPDRAALYEDDFSGDSLANLLRLFKAHFDTRTRISNGSLALEVTRYLRAIADSTGALLDKIPPPDL
jgi:predicted dehydrogenase